MRCAVGILSRGIRTLSACWSPLGCYFPFSVGSAESEGPYFKNSTFSQKHVQLKWNPKAVFPQVIVVDTTLRMASQPIYLSDFEMVDVGAYASPGNRAESNGKFLSFITTKSPLVCSEAWVCVGVDLLDGDTNLLPGSQLRLVVSVEGQCTYLHRWHVIEKTFSD